MGFINSSYTLLALIVLMLQGLCSCKRNAPDTLFQLLPADRTGIDFSNNIQDQDSLNIIQYIYYYNGGGVAVGDINNDDLPDIYFISNLESNRLYLNRGNLQFEDITETAGVGGDGNWSTGVAMVDINADGWLDIYVCQVGNYKSFKGKNQLFINNGSDDNPQSTVHKMPSFRESAAEYGLDYSGFSTQAAFLDYDNDNDLDMYLLCHAVHSTETYRDTSLTRKRNEIVGDKLFRNDLSDHAQGEPHFIEVGEQAGIISGTAGYGLGISIGDVDQNGCPDIYIGNDFHENDFLLLNNCQGGFSEVSSRSLGHSSYFSMGNDMADLNNDTWLDIVTLDMKPARESILKRSHGIDSYDTYQLKRNYGYSHQSPRNMLHLNQKKIEEGEIRFSEIGQMAGIATTDWSWSALLADFDNDGRKDMHITNGILRRPNDLDYLNFIANKTVQENASDLELVSQMPEGKVSNYIFTQQEDGTFKDQSDDWGLSHPSFSHGAAYSDLDKDGDLDLVVNNMNEAAFIYENQSDQLLSSNGYLTIRFKGPQTNPRGVGAKVFLFYGDSKQYQELYPVRGWQSSVDFGLHFGLGQEKMIDSVVVEWNGGKREILRNVKANQSLTLSYQDARYNKPATAMDVASTLFTLVNEKESIPFQHRENTFYDNQREALIPYFLSTQGACLAVADVNGDGLEDAFFGGASQQSGSLFLQTTEGHFAESNQPAIQRDSLSEDTGLALFDADGDQDLDLYVGSGGNQFYYQNEALRDRLYLNDGHGNFSKIDNSLPIFFNQSSCIKPADFDQDGDLDIFVGSRSVPANYGKPADSYLLINDGNARFSIANKQSVNLTNLGMVSDASWTDFDSDGDPDLVVVGEWMPLTIFENQNGTLVPQRSPDLQNSSGWWSAIESADIDQDGDEDWIVGNFGTNSPLRPTVAEPVQLYISDFDMNLSRDPILTFFRQNIQYPFADLDELSKQLVFLKKRFRKYAVFSNSSITEIFTEEELKKAVKIKANIFQSVVVRNDGKGQFKMEALPLPAQMSPVQAILIDDLNVDGSPDVLLGGNLYEVHPAIGRQDASYSTYLQGLGDGTFKEVENVQSGLLLDGMVKDLQVITIAGQKHVVVARNNDAIQLYRFNKSQ